jgi:hypothetical protein
MNQKIPVRLIKEPLLEVIWEIRFQVQYPLLKN